MTQRQKDLEVITAKTLAHYNERAAEYWEGTHEHDVGQNIEALMRHIRAASPFRSVGMPERLLTVCRKVLKACLLIETDDEINGRISFNGGELQVFANDRLRAPNNDQTFSEFEPALREFLTQLFNGTNYQYERGTDPRERFTVNVKTTDKVTIKQLLNRLPN